MEQQDSLEDEKPIGSPGWMTTFADLMSLLMCFFVLLLSFSEMDVIKFKQIAGAMKNAFGVQAEISADDVPKGTSAILQEFSPGAPDDSIIDDVRQHTSEKEQQFLDTERTDVEQPESPVTEQEYQANKEVLEQALAEEIEQDLIELDVLGELLIIRLKEQGSFSSGSSNLQPRFRPMVQKIARLLNDIPGEISISGHTDDLTISSELHKDNWELSAKRAAAIASVMSRVNGFDTTRLKVQGFASNRPLVPNTSRENRAINRRVELAVSQGSPAQSQPIQLTQPGGTGGYQ